MERGRGRHGEAKIVLPSQNKAVREVDGQTWSTNPQLSPHLTRCQDTDSMEVAVDGGMAVLGKERKPGPGPDNVELSGLRRGVGDISQIRTDHKALDAIQFCGATIRRLIMCHPSICPPPAAVSLAINPLMTNSAPLQSPHTTFCLYSLLSVLYSLVCSRGEGKKGIKRVWKCDCKVFGPK